MPGCPRCGHANEPGARFCSACGAKLSEWTSGREVRKTVTVLFSDLSGSTSLGEALDPESLRRILARYFDAVSAVLQRHGGTVEKFIGDAVVAVFGVPVASEDDALRAVRSAVEMRQALAELNEELELEWGVRLCARTGINTGEVFAGDSSTGDAIVTGDAVNVAARLEQAAAADEILIGSGTERLVRTATRLEALLPLTLKGKGEPVPAWRLLEVFPDAPALERRLDAPMIGRRLELVQLQQAFRRAMQERSSSLFTVLGAAGVGKSRLAKEFVDSVGDEATVLSGRCLAYGEGITFWPLTEIVQQMTGGDPHGGIARLLAAEDDAERVDELISETIGASETMAGSAETFWAVRRLLETLARDRPVVVVLEDLHWAEPTFLDLVDDLAERIGDAPVLIVCLARMELLEVRPEWGAGKLNTTTTVLAPLPAAESLELIDALVGDVVLHSVGTTAAQDLIVEAAEGNPLFIEQMLAMVNEGSFDGLDVPPTIQALLAARLDAIAVDEHELLSRAALIGREFWRGALLELLPAEAAVDIDRKLNRLVRRQLLAPAPSTLPGEPQYRFRHVLVRDAAYRGLPKAVRSELHERFAAWLTRAAGEHLGEYGVIIGYHLERAYYERIDLGTPDTRARELAAAAAERLAAAGRSALARDDVHAAVNLLDRAARLLPPERPASLELALELSGCLFELGETARARELLAQTVEQAAATGEHRLEANAFVQHRLAELRVDANHKEAALRDAARAIEIVAPLGDDLGLARALELRAAAQVVAQRLTAAERTLERAAVHARRAHDAREEERILASLCSLAVGGPVHVDAALDHCRGLVERLRVNRRAAGVASLAVAGLHALRGDVDGARTLAATSRAMIADLGLARMLAGTALVLGTIELVAEDGVAAERELRPGYDFFGRVGELASLSHSAALLARALLLQGRLRESDALTREVEAAAAPVDLAAQVGWRAVRARVLAARGELPAAEALARDAVDLAARGDDIHSRGETLLDLARVLAIAGRDDEAARAIDAAVALLARKGAAPTLAVAVRLGEGLAR